MSKIEAGEYAVVSRTEHGECRWRRFRDFRFAGGDAVAPLVASELAKAVMSVPIGFLEVDGHFVPAAVQGLKTGENLFVAADGRWIGAYVPAVYRGFPFLLGDAEDGQQVLCVRREGVLSGVEEGERFFEADGAPSLVVREVLDFLVQVRRSRDATFAMTEELQRHGLIQPWPISLQTDQGGGEIRGLYRVDEAALIALPADRFEQIRCVGALPLIYCQLLSMQHLPVLGRLAQARTQEIRGLPQTPSGDLDLGFLNDDAIVRFGN